LKNDEERKKNTNIQCRKGDKKGKGTEATLFAEKMARSHEARQSNRGARLRTEKWKFRDRLTNAIQKGVGGGLDGVPHGCAAQIKRGKKRSEERRGLLYAFIEGGRKDAGMRKKVCTTWITKVKRKRRVGRSRVRLKRKCAKETLGEA